MSSHPRIAKSVKWIGALALGIFVIAWLASFDRVLLLRTPGGMHIGLIEGLVAAWQDNSGWGPGMGSPDWMLFSDEPPHGGVIPVFLKPDCFRGSWFYGVSLLWLSAAAGALWLTAWRHEWVCRARERAHSCSKCGYDRRGLPGGNAAACPECGEKPAASP